MNLHAGDTLIRSPESGDDAPRAEDLATPTPTPTPTLTLIPPTTSLSGRMAMLLLAVGSGSALLAIAWWALGAPLRVLPIAPAADAPPAFSLAASEPAPASSRTSPALDLAAFRAPLWVAPPALPSPPKAASGAGKLAAESTPPLKWQLLAIIGDANTPGSAPPRAMIYDPDTDTVYELGIGAECAGNAITLIADGRVMVSRGQEMHTLSLERPVGAAGGGR